MSLTVIIGHRGTGKSSFLHRLSESEPSSSLNLKAPFYDLDSEIEKSQGLSISNIFTSKGESAFRDLEAAMFQELSQKPSVIAVGAGFQLKNIPTAAKVIWVRRTSDLRGRIFTDRPRLILETDPLSEYETKRQQREPLFSHRADIIYTVPEGIELSVIAKSCEKQIFTKFPLDAGGLKTLFPDDLQRLSLGAPKTFELRDDLLSEEQMQQLIRLAPDAQYLYSSRIEAALNEKISKSCASIDQDVQNKTKLHPGKNIILSSHNDNIYEGLQQLSKNTEAHLKLSPLVLTWKDLWTGHQWQQQDPKKRSFLPRSLEGRWKWYRLYQKGRQNLNFWYESQSSAADQPSLLEWLMQPEEFLGFGAVLGSPVEHSLSPMMHFDFFKKLNCCFYAIDVKASEWDEALPILQALGLKAAAVTSPLKKLAFKSCAEPSELAQDLKSVNTILWSAINQEWLGTNTDLPGFLQSLEGKALPSPFVIWGGEGVLSIVKKALPEASAYSARHGKPKSGNAEVPLPSTLVWAAPSREGVHFPPSEWAPRVVLDLNYAENSWGRQYAVQNKARYQSGLEFFRCQALEQQKFWESFIDTALKSHNS